MLSYDYHMVVTCLNLLSVRIQLSIILLAHPTIQFNVRNRAN